ncbi:A/G-specific adenine DNA glycosylase [Secundilactobacillus oryzae JCM 18671]|uniref:Adenine DNA glycosylase n=1 Tax=Secundilactobacillus oryzae JCM 18671 TaxID=1291743 RepID=A0A081BKQ9_9LACO|nr:A/G-specific adenine glycosylase [Secundilactobacillus oryzae]GAK48627.1 A/G-specific adenine DNA glycosylase [Secundilactobacillus oryzae JCM 18671]
MISWSADKIHDFQETLLAWYDAEKRDLPWRHDQDPYHVWISEIMLQQTQVQTVIPYYERFMAKFPTVADLAAAPEPELLKAWEGLGYYSRARNLKKAAIQLVTDYEGVWPKTAAELQALTGIGPYTAGAIASIAFGEVVPAIDGNAFRVFSRLLKIDADIAKPQTRKIFEAAIQPIVSPTRPGDFNQAIMDLGSSYMTAKNPDSEHSPVKTFNQAYLDGVEDQYPVKTKKARPILKEFYGLVIESPEAVLMVQRPGQGMLANLWTYPLVAKEQVEQLLADNPRMTDLAAVEQLVQDDYQLELHLKQLSLKPVSHTFTHQKWQITLLQAKIDEAVDLSYFPGKLLTKTDLATTPVPTIQAKMAQTVEKQ